MYVPSQAESKFTSDSSFCSLQAFKVLDEDYHICLRTFFFTQITVSNANLFRKLPTDTLRNNIFTRSLGTP